MRLVKLRVRNFRSIDDLSLSLGPITVLCGPNSCGKSNVMRAIEYAFRGDPDRASIYHHMIARERDQQGGPTLSIWIDMWFADCTTRVRDLAKSASNTNVRYRFRAFRSGKVERSLDNEPVSLEDLARLKDDYLPVYVPTIRDPAAGGMQPFQQLFADVLKRSRGETTMASATQRARSVLEAKARPILREHRNLAARMLNASGFELDTENVSLEGLYRDVDLSVTFADGRRTPIGSLGTGHQSLLIMNLYRQLGEEAPGHSLYLFEEPDSHLHPTTLRAVAADLTKLSESAQVVVSTHSPALVNLLGLKHARSLYLDDSENTCSRTIDLGGYQEGELRHLLMHYGIRATEPLFAKRIILVEGSADVHVLTRLIELRHGRSPDQMDVLMVNAGGKEGVAKLAELLTAIGAPWRAVIDWDAALSTETPYIRDALQPTERDDVVKAIASLAAHITTDSKRGKNGIKLLRAIADEIDNGPPTITPYDGSIVERLVKTTKKLSAVEIGQLKDAIKRKRRAKYRRFLELAQTWLWSSDLEECILSSADCIAAVESTLINRGRIAAPFPEDEKASRITAMLHNAGGDADLLAAVVDTLEDEGLFARTEVNQALSFLLDGVV